MSLPCRSPTSTCHLSGEARWTERHAVDRPMKMTLTTLDQSRLSF